MAKTVKDDWRRAVQTAHSTPRPSSPLRSGPASRGHLSTGPALAPPHRPHEVGVPGACERVRARNKRQDAPTLSLNF